MKFFLPETRFIALFVLSLFFVSCGNKKSRFVYPDRRVPQILPIVVTPQFGSSGGSNPHQNASSLSFQASAVVFGGGIRGPESTSASFRMRHGGSIETP